MNLFARILCLVCSSISLLLEAASSPLPDSVPARVEYNRDVRPLLSDNCFYCHGNDPSHRKAKLRLDIREEALRRDAFVPGKASESELVKRILSQDPDELMPPSDSHKKLSPRDKEVLKRWIDQGAEYQQHWAYERPSRSNLSIPPGGNAVDVLVDLRLKEVLLQRQPEADRRTLIRRIYFDLIGLPPSPSEVQAFLSDQKPDAYSKTVERLLADAHFGERMAMGWLDVVRFADTIGYHSDTPRNVWPYRDWVIRSFNENKRFDRFTIEQIAGDLLPEASQDTRVASAFNRLILSTEEGGAQAKDYEQRMLTDRVRAIGAAWLGQTTGCAQCHDHKFDPFTQRDFYSLGAFFADIKEPVIGKREEGMLVPNQDEAGKLEKLRARIEKLTGELEADSQERRSKQLAWEASLAGGPVDISWKTLIPQKLYADRGSKLVDDGNGVIEVGAEGNAASDTYFVTVTIPSGMTTGLRLEALAGEKLPRSGPGRAPNGDFLLNEFTVKDGDSLVKIGQATATYEQKGRAAKFAIDGKSDEKDGWAVLGNTGHDNAIYFEFERPLKGPKTLTVLLRQVAGDNQTLGRFRLAATEVPAPIRAPNVQFPETVLKTLQIPSEKRSPAQSQTLAKHFRAVDPEFAVARQAIADAQQELADFEKAVPHCLVTVSMQQKRTVRILPRGNWMDESGEVVKPRLPHYLPQPSNKDGELTRLDLAQWLVSRDNPLTARTVMNRLWKQFFGMGLSKVLDDLGAQGETPPNQALLDWLACEFMDSGWDMKHMVRLIVESATYRQASTASEKSLAEDPYNRSLSRQSPFRLDAELVRDQALAVSGLLVSKIGGPSAKPYQPEGYWENLNFPTRVYPNDKGEGQYRRGLYTWWQRSFLHPSLLAFDAPTREECSAERARSNIPQQALVLLNDPSYVEAARAFAARILKEANGDARQRMNWAWQQVLQRNPDAQETQALMRLVEERKAEYEADSNAAKVFLRVGDLEVPQGMVPSELAAWTHAARVLLNLHETITRD